MVENKTQIAEIENVLDEYAQNQKQESNHDGQRKSQSTQS